MERKRERQTEPETDSQQLLNPTPDALRGRVWGESVVLYPLTSQKKDEKGQEEYQVGRREDDDVGMPGQEGVYRRGPTLWETGGGGVRGSTPKSSVSCPPINHKSL